MHEFMDFLIFLTKNPDWSFRIESHEDCLGLYFEVSIFYEEKRENIAFVRAENIDSTDFYEFNVKENLKKIAEEFTKTIENKISFNTPTNQKSIYELEKINLDFSSLDDHTICLK